MMPDQMRGQSSGVPARRVSDLQRRRALAKTGMAASLGLLAATGIMGGLGSAGSGLKNLHVASGLGLIGFSLWHYSLYQSQGRNA